MNLNPVSTSFLGACIIFLTSVQAHAQSTDGTHTRIHHQYQSARQLGMGDAGVASVNDYAAIFYNPAALARRESSQLSLSLLGMSMSSNFMTAQKDSGNVKGETESERQQSAIDFLQKYYGESFSTRVQLFEAAYVRKRWGFAIIPAELTFEAKVHNQGAPALNARAYLDSTAAYGYGDDLIGLIPGRLSWGVTGKFVNRGYANKQVNSLNIAADKGAPIFESKDMKEGYTVDADLGMLYTPEIGGDDWFSTIRKAKPTFGAVLRNVGEMGFKSNLKLLNKEPGTDEPEKLYRVLDLGSKFELPSFWIFNARAAVDVRDILHPNYSMRRGFHAGAELDWTMFSWWKGNWRFGVNQGYPTFGLSAMLFWFNLDLTTYGEDVGTFDNPKENRMYMLKLSLDI